jgi:O-antigen/teichoic acid export membrane protein
MSISPRDIEEFGGELPSAETQALSSGATLARGRRVAGVITRFLVGQGSVQGMNVLINLLLVRVLSIESFAQLGLALSFQTVFTVLTELGFASTIIPLVGERRDDGELVGRYVRAAHHLRSRTYWMLAPVASVLYWMTVRKYAWGWELKALLLGSVLVALYSSGKVSYFSAPLFIFSRLREYYLPQFFTGVTRLLATIGLFLLGGLNAWTAAGLGALTITANGSLIRRAASKYMVWPERDDAATDKELIRCILPATPAIVFSAFQSQISVFLVSIFGGNAAYIAQVAALGRIAQVFLVLMTFQTIVVEPYIARLSRARLLKNYLTILLIASAGFAPVVLVGFKWPQVFLWILGPKYTEMSSVLGWYVLSVSIGTVAGLAWVMNRARKWLFWSGSILEVVLLTVVQVIFGVAIGVRNTRQAVMFALASSCCVLVAHGYVAVYGFLKGAPGERSKTA